MNPDYIAELVEQGYNHIPVTREVLADLDTPLSTYMKLADGPYSYLLESAQGGEKWGRYSIVGLPCRTVLKVYGTRVIVEEDGETIESLHCDDPLEFVEQFQQRYRSPRLTELPIYTGGLVGYFGYDTVRFVEHRVRDTQPPDTIGTPDILLMVSNDVIVFDGLRGKLQLISHIDPGIEGAYENALAKLDALVDRLGEAIPPHKRQPQPGPPIYEEDFNSSFGKENFMQAVDRIKEYIIAGDVMQVVLSQRMSITLESEPLDVYRALRSLNPSPYMYFMNLQDFHIVSSSPEILARLNGTEVTVRPLAGTRRRGHDEKEDQALEEELLSDPKEIAEHLMLIDLGRNDIGRVCAVGSVEVTEMMVVERYSHVMHIASHVRGRITENKNALDLLRATLPVGTLSGAPKIRAMEIIDELEIEKRGIFGGAVGYLAWNGNMDTAIAIRTAIIKGNKLYIQAGAGVVADSIPRLEWKETVNKARAMFNAAAMSERGLTDRTGVLENPRRTDKDAARRVVRD
ncbi:MAG: anthranilate synthase component I [Pseudomonadales bacterium]|jgi:anthranilate synthase component 1|nr:anthranilate synthase component I [Pseudomonadales bacterium]MDP7360659.1 anthranilate synthase component I [Pseudomonadales bacterium]MDP7598000.1 anthranilate synthase component I [Pseudomonadales bacterium]HJN52622.1 anthranilate synthase component I [Pseudomonadales bacterium]|tara:strand:- start:800 stop:2347 length:1548 start_codon:yes stop_codon:yes gene_type:complete